MPSDHDLIATRPDTQNSCVIFCARLSKSLVGFHGCSWLFREKLWESRVFCSCQVRMSMEEDLDRKVEVGFPWGGTMPSRMRCFPVKTTGFLRFILTPSLDIEDSSKPCIFFTWKTAYFYTRVDGFEMKNTLDASEIWLQPVINMV